MVPSAAGLRVTATLSGHAAADMDQVVRLARDHGIEVQTLASYYGELAARPDLGIGHGAISEDRIAPGLGRLRTASRRLEPCRR